MLDFTEVKLGTIVVHHVGNILQEEGMKISKGPLHLKQEIIQQLLMRYFLSPFKGEAIYNFAHESDLNSNEIFNFASKIFTDPDSFYLQSIQIAKHLYEKSNHHNIKGGEFYLVYLKDCFLKDEVCDAIGLFKSENKETYLKVFEEAENFDIEHEEGININKLDKGCLIFNTAKEKGFKVCIVDTTNKQEAAQYWKNDFLELKPHQDNYFHTNNLLNLTKEFVDEVLDKEYNVAKTDRMDLINKSVNYFSKNDSFNIQEFQSEVMAEPELINAFQSYKQDYQARNQIQTFDEFDISQGAVNGQKKNFKSVLKLDKAFHVYVHGNRELIVRGYDEEKQMNYYQLFFRNEQ